VDPLYDPERESLVLEGIKQPSIIDSIEYTFDI
jgi:hypothetical protein